MSIDPRISQLLSQWESARRQGNSVTVEQLCGDCPELTDELRRHVAAAERPSGSVHETFAEARSAGETPSVASDASNAGAARTVQQTLPGYEILTEIGRGGMGVVYKARQTGLNRLVAIKMILTGAHAAPRERARFYAEAEAVAKLQHPNIVQIYEINERDGCPYFSLEFVEGQTLYDRMSGNPLDPIDAAVLVENLALAVHYAHERGVVHRDLKPANILLAGPLTAPIAQCMPKITDFGLAKQLEDDMRLTQTGMVLGTPCYMAPEQVEDPTGEVTPAVDVYGLGAILYEMLTARPPFLANTNFETMRQVVSEDPVPPSQWQSNVPKALERICLKCLAKLPEERYQDARALADDLTLFLEGKRPTAVMERPSGVRRRSSASGQTRRAYARRPWIARHWQVLALASMALLMIGGGVWGFSHWRSDRLDELENRDADSAAAAAFSGPPIRVGILHSLTGTMAISESAVVDATLMAIDELNEQGGLLGRKIEAIVADGKSDPAAFLVESERLIKQEKVCTVFGCWTSASRRTVRPVFETNNNLLVYPVESEGLEESANILYVGPAPNQQIIPAVRWCMAYLDKTRFFLVGSDYVFPHAANAIIKDELEKKHGEVVGEAYIPIGGTDMTDVIRQIKESNPDVIFNTINGDSNVAFFRALRAAGIKADQVPVVSFSIGEQELRSMDVRTLSGNYAVHSYFQSVDRPENVRFLELLHYNYGEQRVATDAMEAAYVGVHLWAQAVRKCGSDDVVKIRDAIRGQSFSGPGGLVVVDDKLMNTHRIARFGQVQSDGQFRVILSSETPIPPVPYPETRTHEQWDAFLNDLYRGWGNQWSGPRD